jgi:hypothetical protein
MTVVPAGASTVFPSIVSRGIQLFHFDRVDRTNLVATIAPGAFLRIDLVLLVGLEGNCTDGTIQRAFGAADAILGYRVGDQALALTGGTPALDMGLELVAKIPQ